MGRAVDRFRKRVRSTRLLELQRWHPIVVRTGARSVRCLGVSVCALCDGLASLSIEDEGVRSYQRRDPASQDQTLKAGDVSDGQGVACQQAHRAGREAN